MKTTKQIPWRRSRSCPGVPKGKNRHITDFTEKLIESDLVESGKLNG